MTDTPAGLDLRTPETTRSRKQRDWLQLLQASALPIIWVLVIVIFSIMEPAIFFTGRNFGNIFSFQSITLILTLGLLLPMTTGDFDLSIASNLGFSAMVVAVLNVNYGVPIWLAIAVAIVSGVVVGAFNAFVVVALHVNAFIVTLASGTILVGLTLAISGQATVGGVDPGFVALVGGRFLGLTWSFYLAILIAIVLWFLLDFTALGRRLLFVGANPEVARLSGLRVGRLRWFALLGSGFFSAVAGVVSIGVVGAADPSSSASYLLPAFAGVFLGATTISPGRFNVWGTVITVFFLATGFAGLQLFGIPTWVQQVFYGIALVLAVAIAETAARRRRSRRAAAKAS